MVHWAEFEPLLTMAAGATITYRVKHSQDVRSTSARHHQIYLSLEPQLPARDARCFSVAHCFSVAPSNWLGASLSAHREASPQDCNSCSCRATPVGYLAGQSFGCIPLLSVAPNPSTGPLHAIVAAPTTRYQLCWPSCAPRIQSLSDYALPVWQLTITAQHRPQARETCRKSVLKNARREQRDLPHFWPSGALGSSQYVRAPSSVVAHTRPSCSVRMLLSWLLQT